MLFTFCSHSKGGPNFSGATIQLPSNLHFKEWEAPIESPADTLMVGCLQCGFPAGYEGPLPTPYTSHHPSALEASDTSAM